VEATKPQLARRFTMSARETLPSNETQKSRFPWVCKRCSVSVERVACASWPNTSAHPQADDSGAPSRWDDYIRSNATMRLSAPSIPLCQSTTKLSRWEAQKWRMVQVYSRLLITTPENWVALRHHKLRCLLLVASPELRKAPNHILGLDALLLDVIYT
jgi:hypothetical protein